MTRGAGRDTANSTWLGGDADENGGLHERLPYWLNGAVPLAYLLPEENPVEAAGPAPLFLGARCEAAPQRTAAPLVATARRALSSSTVPIARPRSAVRTPSDTCALRREAAAADSDSLRRDVTSMLEYVIDNQAPDGWLGGPANDHPGDRDGYWIGWDVCYALMQWAEAEPAQAPRVQAALLRYVAAASRRQRAAPLDGWSSVRWPEWAAILHRMHDTFDLLPGSPERAMLLATAELAAAQGYNWRAYFTDPAATPSFNASVPFAPGWTLTECAPAPRAHALWCLDARFRAGTA